MPQKLNAMPGKRSFEIVFLDDFSILLTHMLMLQKCDTENDHSAILLL